MAPAALPVPLAGAEFMPAGLGDADLFGLNKRGNLNFRGASVAAGVGVGLAASSAVVFLRIRFGFGGAPGDSAAEVDTASQPAESPLCFFACVVLAVKGIRRVSQSAVAIEPAQRQ